MSQPRIGDQTLDIVSLNAADLAVEELEQRLELAIAGAPVEGLGHSCDCLCPRLQTCTDFCSVPKV